jgi:ADP-ribose pyrophosphatase YjhB (NUDIX family)
MVGVSAVVFDDRGNVLLLRHRFWKKDSWGLPSGYAKKRERIEDAIKREVEEETHLKIRIDKLFNLNSGFKLRIECCYQGFCSDISTLKVDSKEILEARFFSINDLPSGLLESHINLIRQITGSSN